MNIRLIAGLTGLAALAYLFYKEEKNEEVKPDENNNVVNLEINGDQNGKSKSKRRKSSKNRPPKGEPDTAGNGLGQTPPEPEETGNSGENPPT